MKAERVRCPVCTRQVAVRAGALVRHGHWAKRNKQRALFECCTGTGLGGDWLLANRERAKALSAVPDVMWVREDLAKELWPDRVAEIDAALAEEPEPEDDAC